MPSPPSSGDLNSHSEQPGDLDLLTLDLVRNINRGTDNHIFPIMVFLRLFVVELSCQTDDVTL